MCSRGFQVQKVRKDSRRSTHGLWSILSPLLLTFTILPKIHPNPRLSESDIFSNFSKETEATRQLHSHVHLPSFIIQLPHCPFLPTQSFSPPKHCLVHTLPSPCPLYSSCALQLIWKPPPPHHHPTASSLLDFQRPWYFFKPNFCTDRIYYFCINPGYKVKSGFRGWIEMSFMASRSWRWS